MPNRISVFAAMMLAGLLTGGAAPTASAQTVEFAGEIPPGGTDTSVWPQRMAVSGNRLVFAASDPSHGVELWSLTEGTAPSLVLDIAPGPTAAAPRDMVEFQGSVIFIADGCEVWRTDGTTPGTVLIKSFGEGPTCLGSPHSPAATPSAVYFVARTAAEGYELWRTDGTPGGTFLLKDIEPGPTQVGSPHDLTPFGDSLFFVAAREDTGSELWFTDGTTNGTRLVKDIEPGPSTGNPQGLVTSRGRLFFLVTSLSGSDVWTSDGSEAGTVLVVDMPFGADLLTAFGNGVFFSGDDGIHGREPWFTDGTPQGTHLVRDIDPGPGGSQPQFHRALGLMFLATVDNFPPFDYALWKSNGTPGGTLQVVHGLTAFEPMADHGGWAVFNGSNSGSQDGEPWLTDGTAAGTRRLVDLWPGGNGSAPKQLKRLGNRIYFIADHPQYGSKLWSVRFDPEVTGTHATARESEGTVNVKVRLGSPQLQPVSVSYRLESGSATVGADFAAAQGTLTISAGVLEATVPVSIVNDTTDEPNEYFTVALSGPGLQIVTPSVQVVLVDDDGRTDTATPIAVGPFTISAQGTYRLVRSLTHASANGAAITIDAPFVTLDLGGFKLGAGNAGAESMATGVQVRQPAGVVVRNGLLRGFRRAVVVEPGSGSTSGTTLLEGLTVSDSLQTGLWVEADNASIRRNRIGATGGSSVAEAEGIRIQGAHARLLANDIWSTSSEAGGRASGIQAQGAFGAVITGNRIVDTLAGASIELDGSLSVQATENRLQRSLFGLRFGSGSTGVFRGNLTSGVTTPFQGGTDAGNNQ
jgi:ELWxxDGT repeat protein